MRCDRYCLGRVIRRGLRILPRLPLSACAFPRVFCGACPRAHQVEGGNDNNQWSDWEAAGQIKSGDRCGRACDWWNNAERDFDLAREIGVNALRFSVEWSRIEPQEGRWDSQALQRYREMLQRLHQRGILPMVCLHHFSHPLWFERKGCFRSRVAAQWFEGFTRRVVGEVGDLCRTGSPSMSPMCMGRWATYWENFLLAEEAKSALPSV